jgi:hypothetical protein
MMLLGLAVHASAVETRKEDQSAFKMADGSFMTSSAFIKLLKEKLDNKYQDLEIVLLVCESGEFASRAAAKGGLQGNWSVTTAASKDRCSTDLEVAGNQKRKGQDGTDVTGLPIKAPYYVHGFSAQYVKKLQDGKNGVGNKALFEYARDKNHMDSDPQYTSSGATADNMTVHGGKSSNHAVVFSTPPQDIAVSVTTELRLALRDAGYGAPEIQLLQGKNQATLKGLEAALDTLRTALDKSPGEEKAYINISAHGNYDERTVAYGDGQLNQPGGGVRLSNANPRVTIFTEDPTLLRDLKEELPMSTGGYWADDPLLMRDGPAALTFTTFRESVGGAGEVQLYLNGLLAGTLMMGNSLGADYQLDIPDLLLDRLMPDLMNRGVLDVDFHFVNDGDSIQLAGFEDWLDPDFTPLDYGIGIGAAITSSEFGFGQEICDVDGNGVIDRNDILAIFAARDSPAAFLGDPRDSDGDGVITVNDARLCVNRCTNPLCAP